MRRGAIRGLVTSSFLLAILAGCYYMIRLPQHVDIVTIQSDGFGDIVVAKPEKASMAALLFYDPEDKARITSLGESLARWGTIAFSIDNSRFWAGLPSTPQKECRFIGGDIERLGQALEEKVGVETYFPPIFIGLNKSAMTVYAAYLHERHTIPAAISWNVCNSISTSPSICPTGELVFNSNDSGEAHARVTAPTDGDFSIVGTTNDSSTCSGLPFSKELKAVEQFEKVSLRVADEAAAKFLSKNSPLPIEELPPASGTSKYIAVFLSGDGGWAGLDQNTGKYLRDHDIGVIGVSGLKYFWNKKTPLETASAVEKLFKQYSGKWNSSQFLLIGYSLGADAVPFIYNRLSDDTRAKVVQVVSIAPARRCDFQVHISDWIGIDQGEVGEETLPEVMRIPPNRFLCMYAEDDETGICHDLDQSTYEIHKFPGNHHFGGNYQALGQAIMDSLNQ